ncbi:MAG: DUF5706 domain-containing protein [Bacteroidota bacterium]|nr:DUF5706 domain-containing protein [Bacteroidota bacterium]
MNEKQLLKKIEKYVRSAFPESQVKPFFYHNVSHTEYVVKEAGKIAAHYQLNKRDLFMVEAAAWFHDTGVSHGMEEHEAAGAAIAKAFLEQEKVDGQIIDKITGLILATKMPQAPAELLEEIICDADLYHLGKKSFADKCETLKREREALQNTTIDEQEWTLETIAFMEAHHYHTAFCRDELNEGKAQNIEMLKERLLELEHRSMPAKVLNAEKPGHEVHKEKEHDREKDRPEKGIETMFRITSSNNQRLSDMADNKAHILITVNSIILSAIISLVLRKLDANAFLAYPAFLLLAVSLVAMTFSILATRPSIPSGTFSRHDLEMKQVNLLFFGNFYKMPLEEYTEGMMKVMDDRDFLYNTLIRDVYGQGVVLGKKYRFLRIAYNVFMYGLILSVLAFIIVSAFHDGPAALPPVKPGIHLKPA